MAALQKLNIGCGYDRRAGYTHIDLYADANPDILASALDVPLPPCCADEIIAQDVLEHIRWRETRAALYEWNRLLIVGGRLYLRVPALLHLVKFFAHPDWQS